ncbi:hypothetical protein BC351_23280 [Paenibacillus ferrarius]|uniref:DNA-binding response regulator n=1 Tax=Paenibacillus ferrarius TaxID=1469647 RepID=A0A1V4HMZ8_9BACL|nr:response regulator [Paenibacillus ferrarius]OPH58725.1 hypothetical protein BC351_23280 [Paenibacillus ferrarius]
MYKLMIVEDEPLIRTGLKHYFAWQELGVTSIVDADNGKTGIETAWRERPDLVITDIRMPEMDGLQMIEQIRLKLPDTVFIILTGFNEFEYAQRAIRLGGVHAFLLKPLEYEDSLATIQACMKQVVHNHNNVQTHSQWEQASRESKLYKGSEFVQLLLEEEQLLIEEDGLQHLYEFASDKYAYLPLVVTWLPVMSALPPSKKILRQQALTIIEQALSFLYDKQMHRQTLTYMFKSKLYVIVIMDSGESTSAQESARDHLKQVIEKVNQTHAVSLFMAIGTLTNELSELNILLQQTDKALLQRYYHKDRHLFFLPSGDMPQAHKTALIQLNENDKKQLLASIESANEVDIQQLLQRLGQEILVHMPHISPAKWLAYLQEIISVSIRFAIKNGIPIEGVYSDKLLTLTCVDDFPTLDALFHWLGAWMAHLGTVYRGGSSHNQQQDVLIFEHIASFIKQHIAQDVTLQMVADRFFYNPSYLSRLFKRKLDKNYMRFVTEIRIEYAQECLKKPEHLVTDVCSMCGYKSYKHFVKTFRSITQMTPTDYRKKWGWS